jgi:hypothetical membrane protein
MTNSKTDFNNNITTIRIGYHSSIVLTIITIITFGLAMTAIPNSGAFCPGDCFEYPYIDTLSEYPKDYLWMYPATILVMTFMVFVVSIHSFASKNVKIVSRVSLTFAVISTIVLLVCYFIQYTVVPASLLHGETKGISLLTQYNPHGVFIALEELGYLMMSLSFIFLVPIFSNKNRLENTIRYVYIIAFILTVVSFVIISIKYGAEKQDRFEVVVISINWLVLIINGTLTGIFFRRVLRLIESK